MMRLTFLFAVVVFAVSPVMGQTYTYDQQCLNATGAVKVHTEGNFVADTPNDSLQRVENAATLNAAIADAPSPGTVCLPQGEYYLFPTSYSGQGTDNIEILRDSITIWGAGNNQNGNGTGLHTRGSWHENDSGDLVRGNGLAIEGSDSEVFKEYTLRDFELDGESGITGDFSFPATPDNPDAFDLSHKGIKIKSGTAGSGTAMKDILIENIWLHGYQGEITHAPGYSEDHITNLTFRNNLVEDSNGGSMNFQGKDLTIKNNHFRNTQGWGEIFSWPGWEGEFIGNTFEDQHGSSNGYSIHSTTWEVDQPWVFKNNTFRDCNIDGDGGRALAFTGGISDVLVENNKFIDCQFVTFQYIPNPDDPTEQGLTPWNQNITIRGNIVSSDHISNTISLEGGYHRDITIKNNTFKPETVNVSSGRGIVDYCCGNNLESFVITENTFKNISTEAHKGGSSDAPKFAGDNTFVNVGWNIDQPSVGGTYMVEGSRLEPRVAGNETGEMYLPTEGYADGHVVTLKNLNGYGTPQFSTDNPSVSVPRDTALTAVGDSLILRYDTTSSRWKPVSKRRPKDFSSASGWATSGVNGDTISAAGARDGTSDHGGIRSVKVDTIGLSTDTLAIQARLKTHSGPSPFSVSVLRLATSSGQTVDRVQIECSRLGECRLTWRKGGELTKGNWQQIGENKRVRLRSDGQHVWAEHDADVNGQWEGVPLDQDGYTTGDDRVTLDLGSDPHTGVGCRSNVSGQEAECLVSQIRLMNL